MRWLSVLVTLFFAAGVFAQNDPGVIAGHVTGPRGEAMADAPVQAKNVKTRAVFRVTSSPTGAYRIARLPAGTYDVSVTVPGFSYDPYSKPGVEVQAAQTVRLDIRLAEGSSLFTLGDDPERERDFIRRHSGTVAGPAPRMPDGKPDFSGVWNGRDDLYPEEAALLPWAADLTKQRLENHSKDHPSAHCLPGQAFPVGVGLWKLVQTPALLLTIFEDVQPYRQVFLDGRKHPENWSPSWLGHSIGRWERDTLVIDTVGFNDLSWMGVYPHTEMLHVTERYQRPDRGHLDIRIVAEDPGTFTKPWNIHMVWELAPHEEILEFICENNKDTPHMVGK